MTNYWKKADDPSRCDAVAKSASIVANSASATINSSSVPLVRPDLTAPVVVSASVPLVPVITEPVAPICPRDLARRKELDYHQAFETRSSYCIDTNYSGNAQGFRNLCMVQDSWER